MAADRRLFPRLLPGIRRPQAGMTLIEVLVAILLISFGIVGLLGVLATSVTNSTDAENRNRAALIANQLSSQMVVTQSVANCVSSTDPVCLSVISNVANPTIGTGPAYPNPAYLPNGAVKFIGTTANSTEISVTWTSNTATPAATYITQVMLP